MESTPSTPVNDNQGSPPTPSAPSTPVNGNQGSPPTPSAPSPSTRQIQQNDLSENPQVCQRLVFTDNSEDVEVAITGIKEDNKPSGR
jgi:hypothetical protein